MDYEILKKIYVGTASTTVALACLATFSSSADSLKYIFLVALVVVQFDFYRRLARLNG